MRALTFPLAFLLLAVTTARLAPPVHPDDIMDTPIPSMASSKWTAAPGRELVTLNVGGAVLRGYAYAGGAASAPVLVMFGGSGNLVQRHDAAARVLARGASAVIWYDYRGYGFSGGTAHFELLQSDAVRIVAATRARYPGRRLVVLGYSMGTDIAEYAVLRAKADKLILLAPWSDAVGAFEYGDPKHTYVLTPAAARDYDEVAMIQKIQLPLLVVQGTKDEQIPPAQGRHLEAVSPSNPKSYVPIPGANHEGLLENPQVQQAIAAFLQ